MSSERLLEIAIDYRQELRVWATATDLGLDTLAYCSAGSAVACSKV